MRELIRSGRHRTKVLSLVLYAAVLFVVFFPAITAPEGKLLVGDDIHRQYYFYRQFFNAFMREGIFPWWNPYGFAGAPFIANPVVNIWYPATWLFFFLPLPIAYLIHIMLHLLSGMMGMNWLLVRIFRGEKEKGGWGLASWAGGLAFGLSGFFMARVYGGHVDVIAAASYMPWVLGAFWGLMSRPTVRALIVAAAIFALQLFAGYQTMAFFTVEAVFIASLVYCISVKSIRPLLVSCAAGVLGVGLAGLQLVPEQEFFRRSIRTFPLPYEWISYGSLVPKSLLQFVYPFFFGNHHTYQGPPPNFIEHAAYVGIFSLALSLVFLFRIPKLVGTQKGRILGVAGIIFGAIVVFSLWMSLGNNARPDLQKTLWKLVPMYHYLRIPPRHLILAVFGLSGITGLSIGLIRSLKVRILVTALIALDLVYFALPFVEVRPIPETRHDTELIALLQDKGKLTRTLQNFGVWVDPRDSFDFDAAYSNRVFSATGYDPSILRNYYEYIDAVNGTETPSILSHDVQVPYSYRFGRYFNAMNIKYVMYPTSYDLLGGKGNNQFRLALESKDRGYRVYENMQALPRIFTVPKATMLPTRDDIARAIRDERFDPTETVLLAQSQGALSLPECTVAKRGSVKVLSYNPNRVALEVDAPCDLMLFVGDTWYPGWKATVDEMESRIYEANLAFRAVVVPKGNHTVTMRYEPTIFFVGFLMSISALSACAILSALHARRVAS